MRIAIIDLLFSWPPHGGADVDVYHVAQGLMQHGHEIQLFFIKEPTAWERGLADPALLPFPAHSLVFSNNEMTESSLTVRVRDAIEQYRPDYVFLTQAYFLKVPLILALRDYRVVSRCYAHETACHRDILRFRNGAPCIHDYRSTPDICRKCALESHRAAIVSGAHNAWTQEYMAARAWAPEFHSRFLDAMQSLHSIIVTNRQMAEQVSGLCSRIHIIPHGVDASRFVPAPPGKENEVPVLFSPGRMEDPAKGMQVLLDAAALLADSERQFKLRVTLPEGYGGPPWLQAVGKAAHEDMPGIYQQADICVVPSVWEEPFGIVALEAMASGLPVCGARTGGLQDIILHEETGLLFDRGNPSALADALKWLIDDPPLRNALGSAGRMRVLGHYCWEIILEHHYSSVFN